MRKRILEIPADSIFVGHISLTWIGFAHSRKWGSKIVINGRERPGGIRTKGSLATWFSRVEPVALRLAAKLRPFTVVAVCESHGQDFRNLGIRQVVVVRNVPPASFAPQFRPPPPGDELIVACVGSLYPGRGVEALIDGVIAARTSGAKVRLEITGPAGVEYALALDRRIAAARATSFVTMRGPCKPTEVASRYQEAHVGTALYEAADTANDSLSNKLFESIVAGRPVIAGNLPENRRIVTDHQVGWVTQIDSDSLSQLICEIEGQMLSIARSAEHCYEVGRREFTWETEVTALDKILHIERSQG